MGDLTKNQKILLVIIIGFMIGIIGYYIMQKRNEYEQIDYAYVEEDITSNESIAEKSKIRIHIIGCVVNEGVFELEEGSRILDAIDAAGGETADADLSKINLAFKISDGQKINVPSINDEENLTNEYVSAKSGDNVIIEDNSNKGESDMVNINQANQTELETLPGIGPSTALKIIEHRKQNGKFGSIEDLKNVKGIGDSKYEAIKDLIEV